MYCGSKYLNFFQMLRVWGMGDVNQCWAMGKLTAVLNGQFRPSSVSLSVPGVKKIKFKDQRFYQLP
jgi:hypothetical protein